MATKNSTAAANEQTSAREKKGSRREIPGNLPYTLAPGRLQEALKGLMEAERPQKFNEGFLDGVLQMRGGSARAIPPILKKVGMLNSDNSPTDLYSKFKSISSRPNAALIALRTGYSEIFKRNEYAHKLSDSRLKDIIIEITGLRQSDQIASAIFSTFSAFNEFARDAGEMGAAETGDLNDEAETVQRSNSHANEQRDFNLVNTINIVLPETTDVQVYNAIFKSIRENLL